MTEDNEIISSDLVKSITVKRVDDFTNCILSNSYPLISKSASPSPSFWASELGYGDRQIYLRRLGTIYTDLLGPKNMLVFEHGTYIHNLITNMYKVNGIWMSSEERIYDIETNVSGRVDVLIDVNSTPVPVEIKSVKKWGFNEIVKKGRPNEGHIEQLNIYLKALKQEFGYLHYFSKDDEEQLIFEVMFDEDRYNKTRDRLQKLESMIQNKTIPDRCINADGVKCTSKNKYPATWCQWRSYCYSE